MFTEQERARFWAKVPTADSRECWEWQGYRNKDNSGKGYQLPYGRWRHRGKLLLAHRVSWLLMRGEIPPGKQVCHTCDNPPCVNPRHLFIGDNRSNTADKIRKGRTCRGTNVHTARLTPTDIREIRRRYATGAESYASIAADYPVKKCQIGNVVNGVNWGHVP